MAHYESLDQALGVKVGIVADLAIRHDVPVDIPEPAYDRSIDLGVHAIVDDVKRYALAHTERDLDTPINGMVAAEIEGHIDGLIGLIEIRMRDTQGKAYVHMSEAVRVGRQLQAAYRDTHALQPRLLGQYATECAMMLSELGIEMTQNRSPQD